MSVILVPLIYLINTVLNVFFYIIIAQVVLSWLFAFGVVNTYSPLVNRIANVLHQITEPCLRPIRNKLPQLGGIDFSPFVLLLAIGFIQHVLGMISIKAMGV